MESVFLPKRVCEGYQLCQKKSPICYKLGSFFNCVKIEDKVM